MGTGVEQTKAVQVFVAGRVSSLEAGLLPDLPILLVADTCQNSCLSKACGYYGYSQRQCVHDRGLVKDGGSKTPLPGRLRQS